MFLVSLCLSLYHPAASADGATLRGDDGVEALFALRDGGYRWSGYRDTGTGREWSITGPLFSLQTDSGGVPGGTPRRTDLGDQGFAELDQTTISGRPAVILRRVLSEPPVEVRQQYSFCPDGRTLRIATRIRAANRDAAAAGHPLTIQRVGLLEIRVPGQDFRRIGPPHVSCPIVGDGIFAGVEHPSVLCEVEGDAVWLAQHSYVRMGAEWADVPSAVFGSTTREDGPGLDGVRRAFLRYLDTVRVKPGDLHVHYNNWWTMPVPFSEEDVLANIAELKQGLYDRTNLFFDSYAMDLGWSDPHSVWEISRERYPRGFARIRDALAEMGCRPGLWVSPSSLYPAGLDNAWLESEGYEVGPGSHLGKFACLAKGGRYQAAFKRAVLKHARRSNLGHVKFDGLAWPCEAQNHPHRPGFESFQPIAEGLMDVFDALREQDPTIALEPTCLGYYPSPWWLMHTPFVIGPFGDDSPRGRCPCPEWIESMTTAREIAILRGRGAFWMPNSALECFDIVIQCPGDFQNHAVMAIGRGRWFLSTYINPRFMDGDEWRFFADLVRWARANRDRLDEPEPFGGDPAQRQAYGYAYSGPDGDLFFARNPWIEEAEVRLPSKAAGLGANPPPAGDPDRQGHELRMLYPRREVLCRTAPGADLPPLTLGPYELAVFEAVLTAAVPLPYSRPPRPGITWRWTDRPGFERLAYAEEPPAYGPSWTAPDGDAASVLVFSGAGQLRADAESQLCLLVEGTPDVALARCEITVDGHAPSLQTSGSKGAFGAAQAAPEEHWQWFMAPLNAGKHEIRYRVTMPEGAEGAGAGELACGVFVRGYVKSRPTAPPFEPGPPFPLYRPGLRPWSCVLARPLRADLGEVPTRTTRREVVHIHGVFLDTLDWVEATAGWGTVQRNRSVMEQTMIMGGRVYHRGIGTHAHSRISYDLTAVRPRGGPGFRRFAATIGCDQEVLGNSIVFVVEGDGRELFRSPLMRCSTPVIEIEVPIAGVRRLSLVVEDGGDGIAADHGNWAEARLLH